MALFTKKIDDTDQTLDLKIPHHLAIIMDGNGRWAKKRLLNRVAGHKVGVDAVKKITIAAQAMGVEVLSLYAFSTENWSRPQDEVSFLMKLPISFFERFVPDLIANNVRMQAMGDLTALPVATQKAVADAVQATQKNTGMILNFALNYGGQADIIQATQSLVEQVKTGQLDASQIDQEHFEAALQTASLGDLANPDLVIRTSGEQRLSNFLTYQSAYSELYFTDTLWPDFDQQDLQKAIESYTKRDRRFGGLNVRK
ncbi:isoprenyl transferase [Convivina praedatoris]|uniref:Isoprenyl transferase n=1 Tax=Convivina praedatoris TaxID=2880963 RepID=A0ABN8HB10_9LACO|nr:isoprenyl transferase [Convivina sp. LMG 32447]CAH1850014.1 Ditrans,polycis-undecaprenyl-diphosphate synthase ((2E,6E)-farnesyl-diphosphate specific) [Convivina sp. LMG 32447]CAH1850022.1 Ditrans,polycis-undecaprenyl-diphosphate synthase ((2E,6E)-farnesyl-diphosphate specific) [Convivina sp. LMG 32447]CAH1851194.1 Ditrans,polycis-undecaprenyl-diphosphate synthase ((2E,6E)-farnesyl-diphosphate specific) [Convivina sp. LMG 32447]